MTNSFELLETMRWTPRDGWYLLDRHLARLAGSVQHFGFVCSAAALRTALDAAVASATGPQRVRLLLSADGAAHIELAPLELDERRLSVRFAAEPIDPANPFLFHKTTNRLVYERARRPGCDDVILWNPAREVTETTIANLVVETAGGRVTPPIACGLLAGTMRAELLATGEISEARVTIEQAQQASRLWLVNSVRGWCPAVLLLDEE